MDRRYLAAYITGQYAALIKIAAAPATDALDGFGPALDMVLRQLGLATHSVDQNPALDVSLEADALLLTDYYALVWLVRGLAAQVTNSQANYKTFGDQFFTQAQALLAAARARVPDHYPIESGDFSLGRLQLDFFEPNAAGGLAPGGWWG